MEAQLHFGIVIKEGLKVLERLLSMTEETISYGH